MNVKIAENAVTFKITEAELAGLLSGDILQKTVMIGASGFTMAIDPVSGIQAADGGQASLTVVLDRAKARLTLYTSGRHVKKLADMGKSREGLSARCGELDVFLQVDIRNDSRPKKPG